MSSSDEPGEAAPTGISITEPLPATVRPPLRFREPGGAFEGTVGHPRDLVDLFEPIDVLNGASELVDTEGTVLTIHSEDPAVLDTNEYPADYGGLYYLVRG
jgi:uncharacterized cupin superfamily protein